MCRQAAGVSVVLSRELASCDLGKEGGLYGSSEVFPVDRRTMS